MDQEFGKERFEKNKSDTNHGHFSELPINEFYCWFEKCSKMSWKRKFILYYLNRQNSALVIQRWFRRYLKTRNFENKYGKCRMEHRNPNELTPPRVSSFTVTSPASIHDDYEERIVFDKLNRQLNTEKLHNDVPIKKFLNDVLTDLDKDELSKYQEVQVYQLHKLDKLDYLGPDDDSPSAGSIEVEEADVTGDNAIEERLMLQAANVLEENKSINSPHKRCGMLVSTGLVTELEKEWWSKKPDGCPTTADVDLEYLKQGIISPAHRRWYEFPTVDYYYMKWEQSKRQESPGGRKRIDDAVSFYLDVQKDSAALHSLCSSPRRKEIIAKHLKRQVAALIIQRWYRERKTPQRMPGRNKAIAKHLQNQVAALTIQRWYRKRREEQQRTKDMKSDATNIKIWYKTNLNREQTAALQDPLITSLLKNKGMDPQQSFEGNAWKKKYILELLSNDSDRLPPEEGKPINEPSSMAEERTEDISVSIPMLQEEKESTLPEEETSFQKENEVESQQQDYEEEQGSVSENVIKNASLPKYEEDVTKYVSAHEIKEVEEETKAKEKAKNKCCLIQ